MFLAQCERLGRQVLIWVSDVEGMVNTEHGIVLRYRCACGEMAEMLTGSQSPIRVSLHAGATV